MIDFEERRDELLEKIEEMTRRKQYKALRDILVELEPADIADLFDDCLLYTSPSPRDCS